MAGAWLLHTLQLHPIGASNREHLGCMSDRAASHTVACNPAKSVTICAPGQHWLRQPSSLDVLLLEGGLVGHDETGNQVQRGLQILPPQLEQGVHCMTHDALPGSNLQHQVVPAHPLFGVSRWHEPLFGVRVPA